MARLESACFSCPGFDWAIRYLCVVWLEGVAGNLRPRLQLRRKRCLIPLQERLLFLDYFICISIKFFIVRHDTCILVKSSPSLPVSPLVSAAFVYVWERPGCDGLHACAEQQTTLLPVLLLRLQLQTSLSRIVSSHSGLVATRHSSVDPRWAKKGHHINDRAAGFKSDLFSCAPETQRIISFKQRRQRQPFTDHITVENIWIGHFSGGSEGLPWRRKEKMLRLCRQDRLMDRQWQVEPL